MKRSYTAREIGNPAKIIGVDVARFGDDESALAFRQGIQVFTFKTYRNLDSTYGAGLVTRACDEFGAHACFVADAFPSGVAYFGISELLDPLTAGATGAPRKTEDCEESLRQTKPVPVRPL
jgi:hypothetical protein